MRDLISVIVPVYNVAQYLDRCLNSLLNQTYRELEILLIDDGSKDNSLDICNQYAERDERVKVIHKNNEGLGLTRNCGLQHATGKYVVFVDSDDYMALNSVELLYKDITQHEAQLVIANHYYKDEPNGLPITGGLYVENEVTDIVYMHMLGRHAKKEDDLCVSVWSNIYRLDIIKKHNICFPSERKLIWEDLTFNSDYLLYCDKVFIEETPLYYYCYNGESLTHSYDPNKLEKVMTMYKYMQNQIIKYEFENKKQAVERLQNNFIGNIRTCLKLEVFYAKENGKEIVKKNIDKICNNLDVVELLDKYPREYYSKVQYIYNFAITHKMVDVVYILTWLQNKKSRIE